MLLNLPDEILSIIFYLLPLRNMMALHLVCKRLSQIGPSKLVRTMQEVFNWSEKKLKNRR
jgi:hypothetical protein